MTTRNELQLKLKEIQAERSRLEKTTRSEEERRRRHQDKDKAELEELQKCLSEAEVAENRVELDRTGLQKEKAWQQPAGKSQSSFVRLSLKLDRSWPAPAIGNIKHVGNNKKETC